MTLRRNSGPKELNSISALDRSAMEHYIIFVLMLVMIWICPSENKCTKVLHITHERSSKLGMSVTWRVCSSHSTC